MNVGSWMLAGVVGTIVLTAVISSTQGLGLTRMDLPYLLGTVFVPARQRAKLLGTFMDLCNGLLFSLLYVGLFERFDHAGPVFGAGLGALHAFVVLTVGMDLLPTIHPRMASEHVGPVGRRRLEPPGFLALHYGRTTPLSVFVAHVLFGAIVGTLYRVT